MIHNFRASDGFGRTGDLGFYREDGVLCFSGRLKDLIKYQGNHLYPKELETIIQLIPGVAEVVVFGLPDPDVQVGLKALRSIELIFSKIKSLEMFGYTLMLGHYTFIYDLKFNVFENQW